MAASHKHIFYPLTFTELFNMWNRFPKAQLYAGGTGIIARQGKNILALPDVTISLEKLSELMHITRTEHYLEIGPMVNLNRIIRLGKIVPAALCACLESIGGVQLRNIATIGGNICYRGTLKDMSAPLTALDAQYELRNTASSRWVAAARFHSTGDHTELKDQEMLTRIRLPLHRWDYSIYKKFHSEDKLRTKALVFLARSQKDFLTDIRVVYKDNTILRNKNAESILTGKHLPLSHKPASDFIENWREFLDNSKEINEFSKYELIKYIEININNLTE